MAVVLAGTFWVTLTIAIFSLSFYDMTTAIPETEVEALASVTVNVVLAVAVLIVNAPEKPATKPLYWPVPPEYAVIAALVSSWKDWTISVPVPNDTDWEPVPLTCTGVPTDDTPLMEALFAAQRTLLDAVTETVCVPPETLARPQTDKLTPPNETEPSKVIATPPYVTLPEMVPFSATNAST